MANTTVQGMEEAMRKMDVLPNEMLKVVQKSCRNAARITSKQIKGATDPRFKTLTKYKVTKVYDGTLSIAVGYFNGKQQNGHQPKKGSPVTDWFKVYWSNYGTLERRDPAHHFQRKRKATSRDWHGGITPQHMYEEASAGAKETFLREVEKEMGKNIKDIKK